MRRFMCLLVCGYLTLLCAGDVRAQNVSVKAVLNSRLPDLRFENISLGDAMDFLRDVSGANIHVNWRAIEELGIGKDTVINVRLRSVTMRKVLQLVLSEAGRGNLLTYYIDGNVLEITTREIADRQMLTRVYPVDDLLMEVPNFEQPPTFNIQGSSAGGGGGGGNLFGNLTQQQAGQNTREARAQALVDTIQAIISPEIWNSNGGPAAIRMWSGSLIVTAPRSVHEALAGYVD